MHKEGILKFIPELELFEALSLVGNLHQHMGFSKDEKIFFYPEEALFLYIHAKYQLLDYDNFEMIINCKRYKIFDHLKAHGYILMRPTCIYNKFRKTETISNEPDWLLWNPDKNFSKREHGDPDKLIFIVNPDDILNGEILSKYPVNSLIAINEESCFQFLEINNFPLMNENKDRNDQSDLEVRLNNLDL